jgi:outer membrane lipoprotein SlyB
MNQISKRIGPFRVRASFVAVVVSICGIAPLAAQAASSYHGTDAPSCTSCGTVISTHKYQRAAAHGSGLGIATGAVVGGLLGNHVGWR